MNASESDDDSASRSMPPSSSDDDDDADDDATDVVTVCYPGRLTTSAESSAFADARGVHKIGGAPVPLTTRARERGNDEDDAVNALARVSCASCGAAMSLLVQTHAPMKTRARALYVYACARGCRGDDAWTCVRATGKEEEEEEEENGQRSNGASVEGKSAGFGTMDVDGRGEETTGVAERAPTMEDSWDDPESSAWCAEDVGAEALSAELDAMLMSVDSKASSSARAIEAEAKAEARRDGAAAAGRGGTKAGATRDAYDDACSKQFVEYYLLADVEPRGTRAMSGKETARARTLLARYAEREGVTVDDIVANAKEDSEWTGESYERGEATNVDDAYLKFTKRLSRAPDQCARYDVSGMRCVWPTKTPPKPSRCERCQRALVCELQLTPALLRDVEDALSMHRGDRSRLASHEDLLAWDWQTVCVFTCPNACVPDDAEDVAHTRERVVVAESDSSGDSLLRATRVD